MGSVIAFDVLSDRRFRKKLGKQKKAIENLFTVGSPLALFLLRSGTAIMKLPVSRKWINIYDKRDVIATPLRMFFSQCTDSEVRLPEANALTAHLRYFHDAEVLNKILRAI